MAVKSSNRAMSNIVPKKYVREVQKWTLNDIKDTIIPSMGPYGSTTGIIKATDKNSMLDTVYTKDGHSILSRIKYDRVIEDSLQREMTDITRHIVKTVGDGTSSTAVLASLLFDELVKIEDDSVPPYLIIKELKSVVEEVKEEIMRHGRELTLDDIYNICMICTNNNEDVSNIITGIYKDYGMDVFIDVAVSSGEESYIKTYDGLTMDVGFSDAAYINTKAKDGKGSGESIIRNAKVYAFTDPIDTGEMHSFFNAIVLKNIMEPFNQYIRTGDPKFMKQVVPTVIMAPKISLDMNASFDELIQWMYQFNQDLGKKPPLLVITNISDLNYEIYSEIWRICGCKPIKKYIDPEIQKKDIEAGKAPTTETITTFCGFADEVKSTSVRTTFVNPAEMFARYEEDAEDGSYKKGDFILDENNERTLSEGYIASMNFLETELERAIAEGEDCDVTGNLKRRIHSLKSNMVDYYIGGLTVTDRDSVRALVEDAVLNIRSAAQYGVGYGTNFEGFRAISTYVFDGSESETKRKIVFALKAAYRELESLLYNTVYYPEAATCKNKEVFITTKVLESLSKGCPMNFTNNEFDGKVLCTIKQDVEILDTLAKVISIIFTTNQILTATPAYNMYVEPEDRM